MLRLLPSSILVSCIIFLVASTNQASGAAIILEIEGGRAYDIVLETPSRLNQTLSNWRAVTQVLPDHYTEVFFCKESGWFAEAYWESKDWEHANAAVCGHSSRSSAEQTAIRLCNKQRPGITCKLDYSGYDDGTISFSEDHVFNSSAVRWDSKDGGGFYVSRHAQYAGKTSGPNASRPSSQAPQVSRDSSKRRAAPLPIVVVKCNPQHGSGFSTFQFMISSTGMPTDIQVLESSSESATTANMRALSKYKYMPSAAGGPYIYALACPTRQLQRAKVSANQEVTMRRGPSTSEAILRMLRSGDAVVVMPEQRNGYSLVRDSSGTDGWVLTRYLEDVRPTIVAE